MRRDWLDWKKGVDQVCGTKVGAHARGAWGGSSRLLLGWMALGALRICDEQRPPTLTLAPDAAMRAQRRADGAGVAHTIPHVVGGGEVLHTWGSIERGGWARRDVEDGEEENVASPREGG